MTDKPYIEPSGGSYVRENGGFRKVAETKEKSGETHQLPAEEPAAATPTEPSPAEPPSEPPASKKKDK
jgi:hypothetical protein